MSKRDLCWGDVPHTWVLDEPGRGEGLICGECGVTEAELEGIER